MVIGLVGSIIGLFLGLGIAMGLTALLEATGVDLPSGGLVFSTRTIVVSIGVGTLIALLASLRPAIRATRVEPIAAVREGAVMPASRFARYAVADVGDRRRSCDRRSSPTASFADGLEIKVRIVSLVAGVLLMFVGVAMIASRVVRPLAYVLGAPGARFGGAPGKLARQNAVRNPARTASTAAAVMIGLALITFVAVIGQGFKTSFSSAVDELFVGRLLGLGRQQRRAAHEQGREGRRRTHRASTAVSEIRSGEAKVGGKTVLVTGVDANLTKVIDDDWASGSDAVPAQLGRDGAFVLKRYADDHSLKRRLAADREDADRQDPAAARRRHRRPAQGRLAVRRGLDLHGDVRQRVRRPRQRPHPAQRARRPVRSEHRRARAEPRRRSRPQSSRRATSSRRPAWATSSRRSQILYALLGLSVIVSLFGVINTLVLSVFERTRELGMLRAIGMTRRQVRRMIRQESIVTALIGAALGIAVGMFLAVLTTAALSQYGIVFAVPYGTLVVFVGVAILAGMLAAILPARRASRLNVLEALQYE